MITKKWSKRDVEMIKANIPYYIDNNLSILAWHRSDAWPVHLLGLGLQSV